jgi:Biotin-lipoyl like
MRIYFKIIITSILAAFACTRTAPEEEVPVNARVSVEVAGLTTGTIRDELTLSANTLYLKRNVVTSPIPAYVTQVHVRLGDPVKEGQVLYVLETKERRALGENGVTLDSASASFGKINVRAPASGVVSTLEKQQTGDYVLEGGQLCTIAESSSLAFAVNVPYEFKAFTKPGAKCILLFPDNSRHEAVFTTPLSTMNASAQTQTFLAKSVDRMFLPENLIVKAIVDKNPEGKQQILPKEAVLSDAMMEHFWVMKLINDSTAIKVEIKPGNMGKNSVEIINPSFKADDKFLTSGNYGLPDTARVKVSH